MEIIGGIHPDGHQPEVSTLLAQCRWTMLAVRSIENLWCFSRYIAYYEIWLILFFGA
jgi:hypothetical protein